MKIDKEICRQCGWRKERTKEAPLSLFGHTDELFNGLWASGHFVCQARLRLDRLRKEGGEDPLWKCPYLLEHMLKEDGDEE